MDEPNTCPECGASAPKWQGQCPGCGQWNTLVESVAETPSANSNRFAAIAGAGRLQRLSEIDPQEQPRQPADADEPFVLR